MKKRKIKVGDLVKLKESAVSGAYTMNDGVFHFAFQTSKRDVGILLNPHDVEGASKVLMREQIVWIAYRYIETVE